MWLSCTTHCSFAAKYPILLTHIGFDNTLSIILFQSPLHESLPHSVHCDRQNQVPHVSGHSLLLLVFSHLQSHEIEIVNKIVKFCFDHCHCQCSPLVLEAKIILSVKVTPLCQYVTNVIILGGEQRGRRAERSIAISLLEEPEEEAFRVWLGGVPPDHLLRWMEGWGMPVTTHCWKASGLNKFEWKSDLGISPSVFRMSNFSTSSQWSLVMFCWLWVEWC